MTAVTPSSKIAEILLKRGAIGADALRQAQEKAQAVSARLEQYLLENKLVPAVEITLALADYLHMAPISLAHFTPDAQLIGNISADVLKKHLALPLAKVGG